MDFAKLYNSVSLWLQANWGVILKYLIFLIVGFYLSAKVSKVVASIMKKRNVDPAVINLVRKLVYYTLIFVVLLSVLTGLGFNINSLLALIGAVGLGIGLALKDSLSQIASGIQLVIFRPFTIGDFIDLGSASGIVQDIGFFYTTLKTLDNKVITVPNNVITTSSIVNFTKEKIRRVDATFGIGYSDDIKKAKKIMLDVASKNEKILKEPKTEVFVIELGDSSVNLELRAWVDPADYWDVYFYLLENVKIEFDKNGISIPFPQMDVHLDGGLSK
ncbi:small conductance mechanosensitive channel [Thermotomaculum hydrothermale]|uniref:Small conductance mechanosensitive channel n=1 Tax=Thermotomaculum hydrothermale TaxID=981385 RepID=A0A7R6SZ04_9BACT|nr:mechanosensitive ion channel domain-containing protein [Thermotomaculum hydrothermale]BBB33344.1 small conductance mechanosensitive channel [Thermotomaculum hydrothermale]